MRRFRLRRLWRVNCEAQIIAAGQNLKRLLQKRGWGRRPFPTQAVAALAPPHGKADESPRHNPLKSFRRSVAVVSLLSYGATRMFVHPEASWFSLVIVMDFTGLSFHCLEDVPIARRFRLLLLLHVFFDQESSYVLLQARQGLFQQAGSFTIARRRRRFQPICICGCWLMADRRLLHAQTLPNRACQD